MKKKRQVGFRNVIHATQILFNSDISEIVEFKKRLEQSQVLLMILYGGMSRDNIQKEYEESGEVVPDSLEGEDVVSSDSSDGKNSAGRKISMLSYDLNRMPEENKYSYSRMSPEKKNAGKPIFYTNTLLKPKVKSNKKRRPNPHSPLRHSN
ncbi:hypothetical protein Ahy_A04g018589 [Arachis hypogaea]|uniref:Uncharacterized protein n=1 Tax=Arachis hypogaea TaxID=3818 RepID=A0A445DE10_ARAHY|nr:hypothetical protein Ahy_A04g018589 [Arachis hypogaea]